MGTKQTFPISQRAPMGFLFVMVDNIDIFAHCSVVLPFLVLDCESLYCLNGKHMYTPSVYICLPFRQYKDSQSRTRKGSTTLQCTNMSILSTMTNKNPMGARCEIGNVCFVWSKVFHH